MRKPKITQQRHPENGVAIAMFSVFSFACEISDIQVTPWTPPPHTHTHILPSTLPLHSSACTAHFSNEGQESLGGEAGVQHELGQHFTALLPRGHRAHGISPHVHHCTDCRKEEMVKLTVAIEGLPLRGWCVRVGPYTAYH